LSRHRVATQGNPAWCHPCPLTARQRAQGKDPRAARIMCILSVHTRLHRPTARAQNRAAKLPFAGSVSASRTPAQPTCSHGHPGVHHVPNQRPLLWFHGRHRGARVRQYVLWLFGSKGVVAVRLCVWPVWGRHREAGLGEWGGGEHGEAGQPSPMNVVPAARAAAARLVASPARSFLLLASCGAWGQRAPRAEGARAVALPCAAGPQL
jgi:hypothetical protein